MSNALEEVSNAIENVVNDIEKVSNDFEDYIPTLSEANVSKIFIKNIEIVFNTCGVDGIFSQANVMEWLHCSKSKATNVINAMKEAKIICKVKGFGPENISLLNCEYKC